MDERRPGPWDKIGQWPEALHLLKSILAKTELEETIKWGAPAYVLGKKNVLGIGGFKNYVALWFWNGVFLKDPKKVLINANEARTHGLRQWRFSSKEEIEKNEAAILQYVNEAIANEKAGLSIRPEKKQTVISDFFQRQLDADAALQKAFSQLTPGRQREFVEHIDEAKQEKTKLSRMEKIKPMILNATGLNDKYR
jgi:uncharacterized protein YdeI (YjbR/CyaY-like superfamily)